MELFDLRPAWGCKHKNNFRRGRGHASGNGKTAGYGHKGQKARSGAPRIGFEGGQMPLYRRIPKRGFKNYNHKEITTVNVGILEEAYNDGDVVEIIGSDIENDKDSLVARRLIKKIGDGVKILGEGELTKKLTVRANAFSASAKEKIEAAGGTAEVI